MALREILASFGFSVDDSKLKKASGTVDRVAAGMRQALGVFAAGAVVAGVRSFISDIQETADQLIDTSAQLGVSAQDLQRWQLAAKLSGAQATDLAVGFKNLSKNAAEASKAGDFKKLGVDVKDAAGQIKAPAALMKEVGLAVAGIKNPAERTAKALEVFGKSGNKLIPMFAGGEEELSKLLGRLDELGGGLGDDALEILEKSGDATDELSTSFLSLKSRLAVALFPALKSGIEWLTKTFAWLSKSAKGTKIFQSAVVVMAGAAVIALVSLYAGFLPILAVIAGVILIVEDLWTTWEGGDSITKRAIDSIFGIGTTKATIESIKKAVSSVMEEMDKVPGTSQKANIALKAMGAGVGEAWNQTIGEQLRGIGVLLQPQNGSTMGKNLGDGMIDGFAGSVTMLPAPVYKAIQDTLRAIPGFALKLQNSAIRAGQDFVRGMSEGIANASGELYTAIVKVGTDALAKLKNVFRSNSPSKAAADISESVPQGGAVGFQRGEPEMTRAAGDMAQRALDAVRRPMSFQLSAGQRTAAASPSGQGGGSIQVAHETRANIVIQGGSPTMRQDVRRGVMDASAQGRDALIADLEAVVG